MAIWARLNATTGELTDLRFGVQAYPNDVSLTAMPTFSGPYGYDAGTRLATSLNRAPRTLFAVRVDLAALSAAQKTNVWNALTAGSPPLWATDAGPNAAALAVLQMFGASATLSAADVLEAKTRAATMYAQDNPSWLVHPAFDSTINVPGDQAVPLG